MYDPLGLSIGTTNLVAARNGSPPVARRAVLTLYPHCAPKIGVPEEDPGFVEPGMLMSGFVERIGDSVALVSGDGSSSRPRPADGRGAGRDGGCRRRRREFFGDRDRRSGVLETGKIQALRNGLRTHVGFVRSGMAPRLVSDAVASLTAANAELDLPDDRRVRAARLRRRRHLRHPAGGRERRDRLRTRQRHNALHRTSPVTRSTRRCCFASSRNWATAAASTRPAPPAVGQLGELRDQCRAAKERLSTDTVTELAGELGRRRCSMTVTRRRARRPDTGSADRFHLRIRRHAAAQQEELGRSGRRWSRSAVAPAFLLSLNAFHGTAGRPF